MSLSKFYVAPNYFEALKSAKAELGEDLLIVNQRKVKVGGFLGLFGGRVMVELEVRVEDDPPPVKKSARARTGSNSSAGAGPKTNPAVISRQSNEFIDPRSVYSQVKQPQQAEAVVRADYQQNAEALAAAQSFQPRPAPVREDNTDRLMDMVRTMQQQLDTLTSKMAKQPQPQQIIVSPPPSGASRGAIYPPNLQRVYDLLYRAEFCEPLINKIMIDMQNIPEASKDDWEKLKEHLRIKLVGLFKTAPQISLNEEAEGREEEGARGEEGSPQGREGCAPDEGPQEVGPVGDAFREARFPGPQGNAQPGQVDIVRSRDRVVASTGLFRRYLELAI